MFNTIHHFKTYQNIFWSWVFKWLYRLKTSPVFKGKILLRPFLYVQRNNFFIKMVQLTKGPTIQNVDVLVRISKCV